MEKLAEAEVVTVTVGGGVTGTAAKRRKYYCTYNDNWCAQHPEYRPWLRKVDASTAECLLCRQAFSIKYEGRRAISGHADCTRHKEAVKNRGRPPPPLTPAPALLQAQEAQAAQEDLVTAAELAEIYRGVTHHLSYSSLDCGNQLQQQLLRGGAVGGCCSALEPQALGLVSALTGRRASCGRTKAASLTENVLAPRSRELLVEGLRAAGYFSLASDASNRGGRNYYPLAVRYFSRAEGLKHGLLDCYRGEGGEEQAGDGERAGEAVAARLASVLRAEGLEVGCVSAYLAEAASSDAARLHGAAYRRLRELHGAAVLQVSCRCRLLHECVRKGLKALSFDVEWLVLKVCGELSSSSSSSSSSSCSAAESLGPFLAFLEVEYKELLRRAPVRWLSLMPAVGQVVRSWAALRAHFLAAGEEECARVVWQAFGPQPTPHQPPSLPLCYVHFAHHLMGAFHEALHQLEGNEATCAELDGVLSRLLSKLQRRRADRFYGQSAQAALPSVCPSERLQFEEEADRALSRCIDYLEQRYDFQGSVLKRMSVLSLDGEVRWGEVEALAQELGLGIDLDRLYDDYCALHRVRGEGAASKERRVDQRWVEVFKALPPGESSQLFKLVSFVLSIPVSNGYCERVFRLMTQLWSKERNRLSEGLVKAELQVQLNYGMSCADFYQYVRGCPELLRAARSQLKYRFKKKGAAGKEAQQQAP